jgi:hypothetical protein
MTADDIKDLVERLRDRKAFITQGPAYVVRAGEAAHPAAARPKGLAFTEDQRETIERAIEISNSVQMFNTAKCLREILTAAQPSRAAGVPIWQVGSRTAAGTCWWDVDKATFDRKVEAGYLESRVVSLTPQAAQPAED